MADRTQRCPESPGAVGNGETLALGIWSPGVLDLDKGEIKVSALKIEEFIGPPAGHVDRCGDSSGLSTGRVGFAPSDAELTQALRGICEGKPRTVEGSAWITVAELRSITINDFPAFDVLDDGKPTFTTHAVIRASKGLEKSALRDPRERLRLILSGRIKRAASTATTSETRLPDPA